MARGVPTHGRLILPCQTAPIAQCGLRIVLTKRRNRQIRRMSAGFGYRVTLPRRVRISDIRLGELKPRRSCTLSAAELTGLLSGCAER
jgi:23S rRNA pseudouridine2604 synthase